MHSNRQAQQFQTRSSRRQRGLSPLNPHGSQIPITQTSTTSHTNSTHSSTPHENLYSAFHEHQSSPSIVNTINSNPNYSSVNNITPFRVSNAETLPPTFNFNNNQQHNYPASAPAYQSTLSNFSPTSYPPSIQSHHDSLPSIIQINPQDDSSSSSQLRSIIRNLESMIQTLQTTTTELRQDLKITREENAQLRAHFQTQQSHIHNSPSLFPFNNPTQPSVSISSNLISLEDSPNQPHSIHSNPNSNTSNLSIPHASTVTTTSSSHHSNPTNISSSSPIPTSPIPSAPPKPPTPPPPIPTPIPLNPLPSPPTYTHHSYPAHPISSHHHFFDPTLRIIQDHDILMREFINMQKRNSLLQEQQLEEMTQTRLHKHPTNSKFPQLNDKNSNPSQFREWYNKILSILATDEWSQLYDPINHDIISNGKQHPSLNNHLYSALLLALKDSVETFIQGMTHLRSDGIGVLQALRTAYKGTLTTIEVMQLHGNLLGGSHFRGRNEPIEQFASRTIQIAKDLSEHGVFVLPQHLKTSFISGLGPDFHEIIRDLQKNKLDPEWQPMEIKELINPARTYLRMQQHLRSHHNNYKLHTSPDNQQQNHQPNVKNNTKDNKQQQNNYEKSKDRRNRIEQAIQKGTFKIEDYEKEVPTGRCVYHGTSHPSKQCAKLLELMQATPPKPLPPQQPSQLSPISTNKPIAKLAETTINPESTQQKPQTTTESSKPTADESKIINALTTLNEFGDVINNNKNSETYFRITSNYVSLQPHTTKTHFTIVDSGAYPMMFNSPDYFIELHPWTNTTTPNVTLADGNTSTPIQGYGTVRLMLNNKFPIELHNALYVPKLSSNLFSVKEFLRYQGTFIVGENNTFTLAFPSFLLDIPITNEICFNTPPTSCIPIFSTQHAQLHPPDSQYSISNKILSILYGKAYRTYKPPSKPPIHKPKPL